VRLAPPTRICASATSPLTNSAYEGEPQSVLVAYNIGDFEDANVAATFPLVAAILAEAFARVACQQDAFAVCNRVDCAAWPGRKVRVGCTQTTLALFEYSLNTQGSSSRVPLTVANQLPCLPVANFGIDFSSF
jgi:hypothetical protein